MIIHLVVEGPPPRKNTHKRAAVSKAGRPFVYTTQRTKEFRNAVINIAVINIAVMERLPRIKSGRWQVVVHAYHNRRALVDEFDDLPDLDADAPVSIVLDALQAADVLDDDVRVVEEVGRKSYDKDRPRTEITLRRIPEHREVSCD